MGLGLLGVSKCIWIPSCIDTSNDPGGLHRSSVSLDPVSSRLRPLSALHSPFCNTRSLNEEDGD